MSAPAEPDNPSSRLPLTPAALIAVMLALAAMVGTAAGARRGLALRLAAPTPAREVGRTW